MKSKSQGQLYEHIWPGNNQPQQRIAASIDNQHRTTPSIDDHMNNGMKNLEITKPNNILIEKNMNQLPIHQSQQNQQSQIKLDSADSVDRPHHQTVSTSALISSSTRINGYTSSGNLNGQRVIHRLNGSEPQFVEDVSQQTAIRNYENQLVGHMQQKNAAKPSIPNKPINVNKSNNFQQHQHDEQEIRQDLMRQRIELLKQLESKPQSYRTIEDENQINKLRTEIEFDRRVVIQQHQQNADDQYEQDYTPEVRERITMQMQRQQQHLNGNQSDIIYREEQRLKKHVNFNSQNGYYDEEVEIATTQQQQRPKKNVQFMVHEPAVNEVLLSPKYSQSPPSSHASSPETLSTPPNQQKQHHEMDLNFNMNDDDDDDYNGRLSNTPCVIGANEVYVDQRLKQKQEKELLAANCTVIEGEKLSFKEKMKLFAQQAGEKNIYDSEHIKFKVSRKQREIESKFEAAK